MSEYDRLTGVKQLRVRGLAAVRYCVFLKGIGLNLFRATRVRKARKGPDSVLKPYYWGRNRHRLAKIHFFRAILARTLQFGGVIFKMAKIY